MVERASAGEVDAFDGINLNDSHADDGLAVYEDHRERALISIDSEQVNKREDLLFGAFYRPTELGEMVYTDVLIVDKRHPN